MKSKSYKQCNNFIPARVVFLIISFFGFWLIYSFKAVLSVVIVAMVGKNTTQTNNETSIDQCHRSDGSQNTFIKGDFDWDDSEQALILGGFFYGFFVTQLPGGFLAEKYGGKWILGISVLITAILSLLGPIAAHTHYFLFFLTRFAQGLAEGVTFPAMNSMISKWMPKMERSRGTALIMYVSGVGTVVTNTLAGVLSDSEFLGGWPAIFYLLGIAGIVWFIVWALLIHETPDTHPYISQKEFDYIKKDKAGEVGIGKKEIPWKSIFTSVPVYALIVTDFTRNWAFLTTLTIIPTYFANVLHLDIKSNGFLSSFPNITQSIAAYISSVISDKLRQKNVLSITTIRKVNVAIAAFGLSLCYIAVTLSGCRITLSIVFFAVGYSFYGFNSSGYNPTHVDMAPNYAGLLYGITATFGQIPGFVAPLVAKEFYSNGQTITNWSYVFYLCAAISIFGSLVYITFASAQLQPWATNQRSVHQIYNIDNNKNIDHKCVDQINNYNNNENKISNE